MQDQICCSAGCEDLSPRTAAFGQTDLIHNRIFKASLSAPHCCLCNFLVGCPSNPYLMETWKYVHTCMETCCHVWFVKLVCLFQTQVVLPGPRLIPSTSAVVSNNTFTFCETTVITFLLRVRGEDEYCAVKKQETSSLTTQLSIQIVNRGKTAWFYSEVQSDI